ncbi:MAG: hypothetical protein RMK18_00935 [Armatimonadota bacterium]|nr:hypothetical protein [Armatimonadota bacterium]MCX7776894.1 hypothetical protein [Armatimonadota bacterium]MDW8024420.1 hypothetical protein [Armatimonadota bacterium]
MAWLKGDCDPIGVSVATERMQRLLKTILNVVCGNDKRTRHLMDGDDARIAAYKLVFFTTPSEYRRLASAIRDELKSRFPDADAELRRRYIQFALYWADSIHSPVDLDHNLTRVEWHGESILTDGEIEAEREQLLSLLSWMQEQDTKTAVEVLDYLRQYAFNVNSVKGENLFRAWALKWEAENGEDPFGTLENYIKHRAALFARGNYYVEQYFARRAGKTITQFFNDYSEQADDCRKLGSLGGTTNPVIATLGEDDIPRKWAPVRRRIAEQQIKDGLDDEWAGTTFTEEVVVNAMLGQRPVFLLEGLGRVAFQLRTDKHEDLEYLLNEAPEIYMRLCRRLKPVDEILLEDADELYHRLSKGRIGQSNNHFKVSVTGLVGLKVLREFNAGNNKYGVRLYTNATVTHDLSQIAASVDAEIEGMMRYKQKTGEQLAEEITEGGSVVTSMMGRYLDAMREERLEIILNAIDEPLRSEVKSKLKKGATLDDPVLKDERVLAELRSKGIEFNPDEEEQAIKDLPTLITKMAVIYAVRKYGWQVGNRILSASKRNFEQNTDLENEVRYSTDFGDIQALSIGREYKPNEEPLKGFDWETAMPVEDENNRWWRVYKAILRMYPDGEKHLQFGGFKPEEWMERRYNKATWQQFTDKWWFNCKRARMCVELLQGKYDGQKGFEEFAEGYYGHLGKLAVEKAREFLCAFFNPDERKEHGWDW